MAGNVSPEELKSALRLSDPLKEKINDYERSNWAANLSSPDVKIQWSEFLSKLEAAMKKGDVDDDFLIDLIHYLSTMDTVSLLEQVGRLDETRQSRFLQLLNWVSTSSPEAGQRKKAENIKQRILMTYRMSMYPKVYSTSRIARAIQIIHSQFESQKEIS